MEFLKDENGEELLLKDGQFQVMMEWERPYMEACIEALAPRGDVLEVGFGCGYSANAIQRFSPKSHTIIEYHPVVAAKAREWASGRPGVTIVEKTWQEGLKDLGEFDAIFFDDYPLQSGDETRSLEEQERGGAALLEENREIAANIQKEIDKCAPSADHAFRRSDIDEFVDQLESFIVAEEEYVLTFLRESRLSPDLVTYALEQCVNRGIISKETAATFEFAPEIPQRVSHDRFFHFFWECYNHHMRPGARFSCYQEDPTSKYLDDRFLEEIINNPNLDFSEKTIPIAPSKECKYYTAKEALIILIQKMS